MRVLQPLEDKGVKAVIPPRSCRFTSRSYDVERYKDRYLIEALFLRLKHFRALAIRYDKTKRNFLAASYLAAVTILLA